jgi:hypothetical protein
MTCSPSNLGHLEALGAEPVLCDAYDAEALQAAVVHFRPDMVMHQLTDLPDAVTQIGALGATTGCGRKERETFWLPPRQPALCASWRRASPGNNPEVVVLKAGTTNGRSWTPKEWSSDTDSSTVLTPTTRLTRRRLLAFTSMRRPDEP